MNVHAPTEVNVANMNVCNRNIWGIFNDVINMVIGYMNAKYGKEVIIYPHKKK